MAYFPDNTLAKDGPADLLLPTAIGFEIPKGRAAIADRLRHYARWIAPAISVALLAAVALQLRSFGVLDILATMPRSPAFWFIFVLHYFSGPAAEWAIFHRLWRIPADGVVALVRKMISNELLLGYTGELYFYTWAMRRTAIKAAPFGAIKDVAILSALAGNVATLALLGLAFPFLGALDLGPHSHAIALSTGVVLATSLGVMLFRRRLFSLPAEDLSFTFWVQIARIALRVGLGALMWHLALPDVAVGWWLLLCAVRMIISRLPFVPNKDLAFAAVAVFCLGEDHRVGAMLTMISGLILITHMVLGAVLGAAGLAQQSGKRA
jgi:hypothetical protein